MCWPLHWFRIWIWNVPFIPFVFAFRALNVKNLLDCGKSFHRAYYIYNTFEIRYNHICTRMHKHSLTRYGALHRFAINFVNGMFDLPSIFRCVCNNEIPTSFRVRRINFRNNQVKYLFQFFLPHLNTKRRSLYWM